MPDSYNLVINTAHPVIEKLINDEENSIGSDLQPILAELSGVEAKRNELKESHKDKKEEEILVEEKTEIENLQKQVDELKFQKEQLLKTFASENKQVRQLVDLALLANNMLKGEALANFVKRSVELM